MDHFEFQPKPDMSSTFRHSIGGGFSTAFHYRPERLSFNSTQAKEILYESILAKKESAFPFPSLQTTLYEDDVLEEKFESLQIKESDLKQREMLLQAKEMELSKREQLLIERERQLIRKQMEFQNTQHKLLNQCKLMNESVSSLSTNERRISYISPVKSKDFKNFEQSKKLPDKSNPPKFMERTKKRKSILSILGFKKSKKLEEIRNEELEEISAKLSPEAQKIAMELLTILNTKSIRHNSSKYVKRKKSFRKNVSSQDFVVRNCK